MKENKRYKSNRSKEDIENSKTNYDKRFMMVMMNPKKMN